VNLLIPVSYFVASTIQLNLSCAAQLFHLGALGALGATLHFDSSYA